MSKKTIRHKKSKALIFKPDSLATVKAVFRRHKLFKYKGQVLAAVKHTVENTILLRNLGYKALSPIYYEYKWAGRFTPFKHQLVTAGFMTINRRAFVLNDIGTGKSMSALWAADYLMQAGIIRRALIVSPLSTLERVWGDEIFKNLMHRTFATLHGTAQQRRNRLAENVDFYIINHDGIEVVLDELIGRNDIDLIIVDESAVYRNSNINRYKMMKALLDHYKDAWVWMMTGTPTPNAPTDAYGQVKLIRPEQVPKYFSRFRDTVMNKVSTYKWVPKKDSTEIVRHAMQPSIRFERDQCIDLPPTMYETREAALSKEQKKLYDQMSKLLYVQVAEGEVTAANEAVKLSKLIQICCGVIYDDKRKTRLVDNAPRVSLLKELIEEAGGKIIVFAPLTGVLDTLVEKLSKHWRVAKVDGGVSANARNKIFAEFQDKKSALKILVAHPKTMAHGLTLTAANTIIWYAPYPSAEVYTQANGRIVRPSQTQKTTIIHIEATKTESRIYQRLKNNEKMQGVLLDAIKAMQTA